MAQGKQTPRQKMINLMYLVFIAMLAMQIDQEIIRSYKDTTGSLEETRALTENNNSIFKQTLIAKAANTPDSFAAPLNNYKGLEAKADDLVQSIETLKTELSKGAEYDKNQQDIQESFAALNNTEPSTNVFFISGDENKPSKKTADLKTKIEAFKSYINQTFGSNNLMKAMVARTNKQMVTEYKQLRNGKNWVQYKFYNQPLIAALSNLEVIQSSARGIQGDALSIMLQEKIDADIKFDAYQAIVSAPTIVIQGEAAQGKVAIGNYSSNVPGLTMPGLTVENGQGSRNLDTGSLGDKTFAGTISFKDVNGKEIPLTYNHTYKVIAGAQELKAQKGAIVTADKMNVLYRGLPNPISGSILGADMSGISLSAAGASVSGSGGKWTVTPGAGSTVKLTISGKDPKGGTISQAFDFRIKNVPPPVGQIQGSFVVSMPASSIPNQKVSVVMPDFDFPVSFTVNSFMFKVPGKAGMLINGNSLNSVGNLTKGLRNGDIAYVFNINATATGLGNQALKQIPPVVINVQ
ncbi:type IX secretion system motor protein PorM/GldM [Kaistella jeonii]|uniref:Gliding motility protein GldM n=1 Tax=Kaistella jeonii TaxID=266749 RepID=A0A0C1F6X4_9FLAO|nr:gliding motility protein GldM [Kaistella jeonii]KIA88952.1 gliding motility protein GldM [Kaistella jeonii]SFB98262.1 gliding motility-associated protein GldM [Kaistella jeonii]VEI97259.1 gliding motility-associated protein GldM [Kaistella jeonii]